jgi:hypothetical protein
VDQSIAQGSCFCGEVRYEVRQFDTDIYKCHCSRCRKVFGGASAALARAPESAFSWLQGEEKIQTFQSPGRVPTQFCSVCGSHLPVHVKDYKLFTIPAGTLDSAPGLSLGYHIHTSSKAEWEVLDSELPRFDEFAVE